MAAAAFEGRQMSLNALYHATPLHYLPHILATGALLSKSVLAGSGIAPRQTACRRDRMLGLADFVHFSTRPNTPLLADKIAKGYPHALLVFDAAKVLALPGTGVIPYNTKSWRHREAFRPAVDPVERDRLLAAHAAGAYPSLEVLARYAVGLENLARIVFVDDADRRLAARVVDDLRLPVAVPLVTEASLLPRDAGGDSPVRDAAGRYFGECRRSGMVLPPPSIPFD
jgi:hypothetical protein